MDPFTITLAFGCVMTFSQIDKAMTGTEGQEPDGIVYKMASLTDAKGRSYALEAAALGQGISPGSFFRAGPSRDSMFASYVVFSQGASRVSSDVRFVSAKTCAPVRFVRVRDGSNVDAASYRGWRKDLPHAVRVWDAAGPDVVGMPIDEARQLNPAIPDRE